MNIERVTPVEVLYTVTMTEQELRHMWVIIGKLQKRVIEEMDRGAHTASALYGTCLDFYNACPVL